MEQLKFNKFNCEDVFVIYISESGEEFSQPVADIAEVGTLIDPDTGDDMEMVRVEIPAR